MAATRPVAEPAALAGPVRSRGRGSPRCAGLAVDDRGDETAARTRPVAARPALAADNVEIDRTLVAAYDAVARLPGGEPVRFRLNEWADDVILRDSARSVVVEQRTPRVEVVPVGFDVY